MFDVPYFNLEVPLHATSTKIVRLVTSSVANHSGFSIDEIEDLKMAATETINFFLNHSSHSMDRMLRIEFFLKDGHLILRIFGQATNLQAAWASQFNPQTNSQISSLSILNYLVSSVRFHDERNGSTIELIKHHEV